MHWKPDRIKSPAFEGFNIILCYHVIKKPGIEFITIFLPDKATDLCFNFSLSTGCIRKLEHVRFLQHPAAQAYPPKQNIFSFVIYYLFPISFQKTLSLGH